MSNRSNSEQTNNDDLLQGIETPTKQRKKLWHWLRLTIKTVLYAHFIFIALIALLSIIYINTNPPVTVLMLYREGFKAKTPSFIPLRSTSSTFQLDLINLEDGNFRKHFGIDIEAIKRARAVNQELGRTAQGGSTITQQLARTLFLIPKRTYLRKYLELIVTFELELILGKDRILELYINYAELGEGVYGFNDASLKYYNKPFSKTSNDQKIRMMAILASPLKYTPQTLHESKALARRYKFIYRWQKYH